MPFFPPQKKILYKPVDYRGESKTELTLWNVETWLMLISFIIILISNSAITLFFLGDLTLQSMILEKQKVSEEHLQRSAMHSDAVRSASHLNAEVFAVFARGSARQAQTLLFPGGGPAASRSFLSWPGSWQHDPVNNALHHMHISIVRTPLNS